jgi:hypothetical protein
MRVEKFLSQKKKSGLMKAGCESKIVDQKATVS